MSFENSNYYQVRDFTSVAGEWNSRFANGAMNNMLRFAYSYQNEPREYDGNPFPTVDILKMVHHMQVLVWMYLHKVIYVKLQYIQ